MVHLTTLLRYITWAFSLVTAALRLSISSFLFQAVALVSDRSECREDSCLLAVSSCDFRSLTSAFSEVSWPVNLSMSSFLRLLQFLDSVRSFSVLLRVSLVKDSLVFRLAISDSLLSIAFSMMLKVIQVSYFIKLSLCKIHVWVEYFNKASFLKVLYSVHFPFQRLT